VDIGYYIQKDGIKKTLSQGHRYEQDPKVCPYQQGSCGEMTGQGGDRKNPT